MSAARHPSGTPLPGPHRLRGVPAALLALLLALPAAAELTATQVKQLAKLDKKLAKKELKLADTSAKLAAAQQALLQAQLDLMAAQALPESTPEEAAAKAKALKAASKAVKSWTGKGTKLGVTLGKVNDAIDGLVEKIELIDPTWFDEDSGGDPGGGDPGGGDPGGGDPGGGDPGGGDPGGGDPGGGDPGGGDPGGGDPGGGDPGGGSDPLEDVLDPAASQAILAVDCGDLNGYAEPQAGWEILSESTGPSGITLVPAPLDTVHVAQYFAQAGVVAFPSSVATLDPDQVGERRLLTSLSLADGTVLTVGGLAPQTDLRVLLEVGAVAPWTEFVGGAWTAFATHAPDVDVDAKLGGTWVGVARDLRAATGLKPATYETDLGGIVRAWVPVRTDGTGAFQLRFSSSAGGAIYLASFAVYAHEELPIGYRRTGQGPLQTQEAEAAAFVAAFNARDFDAAEEAALELADDWLRGVALCHLVGWLDGSRDGRVDLRDEAAEALVLARDAGHPGATWLLSQLASFERALAHLAAGGSAAGQLCPDAGGPGFLNPDCAGQIYTKIGQAESNVNVHIARRELWGLVAPAGGPTALHDLAAWNAGTLTAARWEPSPLLPRALVEWAAAVPRMNPQLAVAAGQAASEALLEEFAATFAAFVDLGFAATDFPAELELRLLDAYAASGEHPSDWDPAAWNLFSAGEIAASWWGPLVELPADVAGAPAWADAQRGFLRLYRNLGAYWLQERLVDGEWGGGHGDDVELLLQLFPLLAARRDADDRLLASALDDFVRASLEQHADVGPGYYQGTLTDVEHAGEYVTNPFLALRGAFGHSARALRTAFFNARELLDAADPDSAFAAVNGLGRTHMRSWWFTADGPSDDPDLALDIFLNGRALAPALSLAGRGPLASGHPALADLRALAAGWRDDALSSAGKPAGFPAPVQWPSGALGVNGLWYSEDGTAGDASLWTSGQVAYVLGLLQAAYRGSTDADRWQFLLPAVRMFRLVKDWEDAGEPSGAAGGDAWAAQQFRGGFRFAWLAARHVVDLAADPVLTGTQDPLEPGTTYVDGALLERLEQWVETPGLGVGSAMAYAVGPVYACGAHLTKSPGALATAWTQASTYYRNVWPLLTRHVLHTDRVFLNPALVIRDLEVAWTGDSAVEGLPLRPLVRWEGEGLDLAVSTNWRELDATGLSALAYNFGSGTETVALHLDEGLPPGTWLIEVGAGSPTCDVFPGAVSSVFSVTKRGPATSAVIDLPPGMNLVRLTRTGDAPAAAGWDLAVDPPLLVAEADGGLTASVRVVNPGSTAAPSTTLSLLVAAVAADGSLAAPAVLPTELLLASTTVSLGAVSAWSLPEATKTFAIPPGSPLLDLLQQGYGLQLRALAAPGASEGDTLNNAAARTWFLEQVPPAG